MCIAIIVLANAIPPPPKVLAKCFRRNPHGAGFAWCTTKTLPSGEDVPVVRWRKGFTTFKSFAEAYYSAGVDRAQAHLIHFRLASAGGSGPEFSHPFPVSTKLGDLYALEGDTELGVLCHNGTVPGMGIPGALSDSQVVARRLGLGIEVIPEDVGTGRLVMLTPDGELTRLGAWVAQGYGPEDTPGCWYSNYGYAIPEETLRYRLARWYRGLTADRKASQGIPNTVDKCLVVVDLKGRHTPMHVLTSVVGTLSAGWYVDGDRRVYLMTKTASPDGAVVTYANSHRIGVLALYRVTPPPPRKPKA
jgi:hypothetical protein